LKPVTVEIKLEKHVACAHNLLCI